MTAPALNWLRRSLALAGVLAVGALIWFFGPLVAIAGRVPLAGEPARWAAIAALIALAAARVLWRSARAARRNRRLLDGLVAADAADPGRPGAKEVAEVGRRFEQAVALLRGSRIGGRKRNWRAALAGRPFVYELPWYIIIGAPGAGKTTALVNSGLEFPLAGEVGQPVIRGIGGTRNCDWWFASQAVLIDTAGRYTTQDSDQAADRTAWFGFLALLARYRPRRPINGVLLTLSVSDLLNATPEQRIAHAGVIRERIEELHDKLGIAFPIYVLVTKMDLLAGFMDFFADFDKDERSQVWGATFPYQADTARDGPQVLLARDFAALEKRLNDCLIAQLDGQTDRERRSAIYAFPQQWRVLRQTLFEFLQHMLGDMRAELRPLVRGVYFTSATQEGTPVDRALGGLARALGLPGQMLLPARPSGKSFFVTRLLREVVFTEAGLAGTNLRWRRRRRVLERGLAGLCVGLVTATAVLSWRTYSGNRSEIDIMAARLPQLARDVSRVRSAPVGDLGALLPALDTLRALAADGPRAWSRAMPGLDRGVMLGSASEDAYLRALREALQPRISARLEARLRAGEREHVELIYDTLKAYLMLFGGKNFDSAALRAYLVADWEATLPAGVGAEQRAALRQHLDSLLASGEVGAPSNADPQLIARSRALVAGVPLAQRVYARLRQIDLSADAAPFTVESAAGAAAMGLFVPAGDASSSGAVPAFFTRKMYERSVRERTQEALRQFASEQAWVLGGAADGAAREAGAGAQTVAAEVQDLYLADYADHWRAYLGELRLAPTATLAASAALARQLAGADSPWLALLRSVAHEVSVVPPASPEGANFEALNKYLGAPTAGVEALQALLVKLSLHLGAVDEAARRKALPPASAVVQEFAAAAARAPAPLRDMLVPLATASASQVFTAAREPLARQLATEIAPACNRGVAGRFPVARSASDDMSRDEFARAFGADGLLDGFFRRQLAPHLDLSQSPWTLRGADRAARAEAAESLQSFQRAQAIREAFFGSDGRALGVELDFRPLELDPGIGEFLLDIDGQVLRFRPGVTAAQSVVWPRPGNGGRVQLQLTPKGGVAGPGYTFQGPWALLRLLDRVRSEPGPTPDRSILVFDVEGRKARFEVKSSSASSPIAVARSLLEAFKCPSRL